MANELITAAEMALWTQTDQAALDADPFALEVRTRVSDFLRFRAGHLDWTYDTVPVDVKVLAIWMVRRTYVNPDQEVSSGVGPLSSRTLDEAALAMTLSESEAAMLKGYKDKATGNNGLWTRSIGGAAGALLPETVYIADDLTVNDERPWMIPMYSYDDPGSD